MTLADPTEVGAQVWEPIDPMSNAPVIGGTVLEYSDNSFELVVLAGTPYKTVGKHKIVEANIITMRLEDLDYELTQPAKHRMKDRCRSARSLFRVVSDRSGEPEEIDFRLVSWAQDLWLVPPPDRPDREEH